MELDTYSILYRIANNLLPYFGVTLVMMAFLLWGLIGAIRNFRFLHNVRRAATLYVMERREPPAHHRHLT